MVALKKNNFPDATFLQPCALLFYNLKFINLMKRIFYSIMMIALMASCAKNESFTTPKNVEGYKPVYVSKEKAYDCTIEAPRSFSDPGKLFVYGDYIYMTDKGIGVHIIDNSDSIPKKVAFIGIPGVEDAAVKDGILYADNFTDIVAFDVRNIAAISFQKRVKNVYSVDNQFYPSFATGYFECVDTTKGYVLRWEKTMLQSPKCYR